LNNSAFLAFKCYTEMNNHIEKELIKIAQEKQTKTDPSHDFQHVLRVLNLSLKIGVEEGADSEILIPAALFHDIIVYRKDSFNSKNEAQESSEFAKNILKKINGYPKNKIAAVAECIKQCSFSKGIKPDLLESKIIQDADRLEATGAISIMRTFSSCGQMSKQFYDPSDPFCLNGFVEFRSGLDLFYRRLLIVESGMHSQLAKEIAKRRTVFLKFFLKELRLELEEAEIT
jgi:uncharacterized protein